MKKREFITLTDEQFELLTPLEKREYCIQRGWNRIIPWLHFLVVTWSLTIIIAIIYLLTKDIRPYA